MNTLPATASREARLPTMPSRKRAEPARSHDRSAAAGQPSLGSLRATGRLPPSRDATLSATKRSRNSSRSPPSLEALIAPNSI